MERLVHWILELEKQLDSEDKITTNNLKHVKEQFQKHEVKFHQINFDHFDFFSSK